MKYKFYAEIDFARLNAAKLRFFFEKSKFTIKFFAFFLQFYTFYTLIAHIT